MSRLRVSFLGRGRPSTMFRVDLEASISAHDRSDSAPMAAVLERALLAVGRTRALGLHFFGHLVGVSEGTLVDGCTRLRLEPEPPGVGCGLISLISLATVADLAMGSSARSALVSARLATVTLSIQHFATDLAGPAEAHGRTVAVVGQRGATHCEVRAGGRLLGQAQAWFTALPSPPGRELQPLPWEFEPPPAVVVPARDQLDEREAAAVEATLEAAERAIRANTTLAEELLPFRWVERPPGQARGRLRIGPELGNRVGHVQGAAMYASAAAAAGRALGVWRATPLEGHYQFLRPAAGAILTAEAAVLREGRRVAYVESRLSVDDVLVGSGLFTFPR